jgi:hypothetical protein
MNVALLRVLIKQKYERVTHTYTTHYVLRYDVKYNENERCNYVNCEIVVRIIDVVLK